jgi:hypothetical protein
MQKENLYVAFLNALLGVAVTLLLKGNLLIYGLAFLIIVTMLFIERRWVYEKVFRRNPLVAAAGYAALVILMAGFFALVARSGRDTTLIVKTTRSYIRHLQPGEYAKSYELLSTISKKSYPLEKFIKDHQRSAIKVQDFTIEEVKVNEFDKNKAVVRVSSSFLIYGQNSLPLELVKEDGAWKMLFSPTLFAKKEGSSSATGRPRKQSQGNIGQALKSLF